MQTEQLVAKHYARPGLEQAILDALAKSGSDSSMRFMFTRATACQ